MNGCEVGLLIYGDAGASLDGFVMPLHRSRLCAKLQRIRGYRVMKNRYLLVLVNTLGDKGRFHVCQKWLGSIVKSDTRIF